MVGVLQIEMAGELVGEAADLAAAHGVRLARHRERTRYPARAMRPVARWQLMMALTLSVPDTDWLTPWE